MALDGLQAVIKSLQNKIEQHYAYLSSSETRTRQVLIDPLLKELGWDVSDPSQVELEYSAGTGGEKADYALIANGKPVMVVEAKSLKTQLGDRVVMQALNYANSLGIAHMVITNGDEWRMYDVFTQKTIEDRVIMEFSITRTPAHESVLQSLASWHSKFKVDSDWIPLTEVVFAPNGPIPRSVGFEAVRFEDGSRVSLRYRHCMDLLVEVANWLAIRTERGKWLNFSTGVTNPISTSKSLIRLKNGLYFHRMESYSSPSNTLRLSRKLLAHFSFNASKVHVKFD